MPVRNPEVQEKVFQEVEKNLPLSSPATVQALANLPYLKVFIILIKKKSSIFILKASTYPVYCIKSIPFRQFISS